MTTSFWPAQRDTPLLDLTVGQLLAERAHEFAERTALVGNDHRGVPRRLTYAELYQEAQRLAGGLAELTAPGDLVALWAPNLIEWPLVQYAAALAGVVLVALNPALQASELSYALTHSRASVLLHADKHRDQDLAALVAEVAPGCPALRTVLTLSELPGGDVDPTRAPTNPDLPAMLQYTSGTTGNPKGVLLSHRAIVNVSALTMARAEIGDGAVAVCPLPMFHTAGCVISTLGPLLVGGTAVLIEQFQPAVVLEQLRVENASVLFFVPTVLAALIDAQRASPEPAPALHTVLGGASAVPAALIEAAEEVFGASVINVFGQTELAPVLTSTSAGDAREDQLRTIGRALPQVDIAVLDPATGAVQPLGAPGEICARGYQVMLGYLHDTEATAAALDADGFLHTGDLGSMDDRGYLTLRGRLKELIIRGGENISPVEIELCLAQHPQVLEAAVFALPDPQYGEIVAAAVVLKGDAAVDIEEQLEAHCRRTMTHHKTPTRWFIVDELPRTPTGKVQKFRLAALAPQKP